MIKHQSVEKIHDSGTQGSRKQSFVFATFNGKGKTIRATSGYVSGLRPDRRRKKNKKYVRLCSLDPDAVLGITQHVWSGNVSFVIKPHARFLSETLSVEKLAKILAAIYIVRHPDTFDLNDIQRLCEILEKPLSNKLDKHLSRISYRKLSNKLEPLVRFYIQEFQERIRKGRIAFKISLSRHRGKG